MNTVYSCNSVNHNSVKCLSKSLCVAYTYCKVVLYIATLYNYDLLDDKKYDNKTSNVVLKYFAAEIITTPVFYSITTTQWDHLYGDFIKINKP